MNRERLHSLIDLVLDMRQSLLPQAPTEAVAHFQTARRESLLGVRALVDHALTKLETEEAKATGDEGARSIPLE